LKKEEVDQLINAGFRLCLVSPELQGRKERAHVIEFRRELELLGIKGDAICTKYADLWN
jgi:hypothetical protein